MVRGVNGLQIAKKVKNYLNLMSHKVKETSYKVKEKQGVLWV